MIFRLVLIELDVAGELQVQMGALVDDSLIACLDDDVLFLRCARIKDGSTDVYEPTSGGLFLGRVENKETDILELVARVIDYLKSITVFDFFANDFRWDTDYEFQFVEAVS